VRKSAPFRFGSIRARPPHAEAGQRIGLLGGSFNPPHAAHRQISLIALKRLKLDRVWWIVTPGNPLKATGELAPQSERIAECRRVARDARIVVTGFEAELGSAFTAGTVGFVTQHYPQTRFVWIMGADCVPQFHRWGQWRDIFHTLPIAVIDRPGWHLPAMASKAAGAFSRYRVPAWRAARLADKAPPAWTFLCGPLTSLSSTAIREARVNGVAGKSRSDRAIGAKSP